MIKIRQILRLPLLVRSNTAVVNFENQEGSLRSSARLTMEAIDKGELKSKLTPMQYHVTQERGTERPFTGCYNKFYEEGTYVCIVCEQPLFNSNTKYDSGCGWPAFNDVLEKGKVKLTPDTSGVGGNLLLLISQPGRIRMEVSCSKCNAHLGHVFDDGPTPTRKRFCINSASINFVQNGKGTHES